MGEENRKQFCCLVIKKSKLCGIPGEPIWVIQNWLLQLTRDQFLTACQSN